MGLAGPMAVPGALGIGIVKTATPKVMTPKALPQVLRKSGTWGRGPANEALEYLVQKFPRLAQQVEFIMDDSLRKGASASWRPSQYLPSRAQNVAAGGERGIGHVGDVRLNPSIHLMRSGGDSAAESVNSIAHELQHVSDNLRRPMTNDEAYALLNVSPFSYNTNPYENLANITGVMEQAKFMGSKGKPGDSILGDWAAQMRGRFPTGMLDVIESTLPKANENPADILRALRAPNRVLANMAEGSVPGFGGNYVEFADQMEKLKRHLRSPDALRKAILARKGR
jgi:hypothetical protein